MHRELDAAAAAAVAAAEQMDYSPQYYAAQHDAAPTVTRAEARAYAVALAQRQLQRQLQRCVGVDRLHAVVACDESRSEPLPLRYWRTDRDGRRSLVVATYDATLAPPPGPLARGDVVLVVVRPPAPPDEL